MSLAKCIIVPVLVLFIIVMLFLYRKKTNQVLLAFAISISLLGAYRLYEAVQSQDDNQMLITMAAILGGMVVIWLAALVSNRLAIRRRPKPPAK